MFQPTLFTLMNDECMSVSNALVQNLDMIYMNFYKDNQDIN